ncbi:MAG: enoyl-[acyl-carrier-protein] reductase FabK [Actinobacteria bacterium]|jgi:enoyl-[acyl-carrier protein] reductase II|nr:MAG: enoyl-[acyl-carrier-protein] reductase FabK [Actinomycetota bacterium]
MESVAHLLGTEYPVIMGAMGSISNPELVAAVCEGGGLGQLATVGLDVEGLRRAIAGVRELTARPFGVNLVARNPLSPAMVEILVEESIAVVTTSAGSPTALSSLLRDAGIKAFHVVPSPSLALKAVQAGVDGVVAEGGESGGVQAARAVSTLTLVPHVVETVDVPVVAAGGIHDGRSYAAAFAMGARGVQIGTRLMLSEECRIHPDVKRALLEAQPGGTTVLPVGMGCVRVLANDLARSLEALPAEERISRCGEAWMRAPATFQDGDVNAGLVIAGECAGAIREILPAGEIIRRMVEDGEAILRGL